MRPDESTNQAFIYCLGLAAQRFGIQILFTMAMSNHHHTGIHDPHGNYPLFLALFHKLFAKCQNSLRGRFENFWAAEQTSVVLLAEPNDILDKLIYSLSNPVKDHLVEKASHWPGVSSLSAHLDAQPLVAEKPKHFFRQKGSLPEVVTLSFMRPPGFEHMDPLQWRNLILEKLKAEEKKAKTERQLQKKSRHKSKKLLGAEGVLRQSWKNKPFTQTSHRQLKPYIASRNKWRRIEYLYRNKVFQRAYREAKDAFYQGVKDILFPAGTFWLRHVAQVKCHQAQCELT